MILVGISINTLINNRIIDKAKTATQEYKNAQDYEETQIAKYSNEMNSYINGSRNTVTLTEEQYQDLINRIEFLEANSLKYFDKDNILTTITTASASWTATEDCVVIGHVARTGSAPEVYIDGITCASISGGDNDGATKGYVVKK